MFPFSRHPSPSDSPAPAPAAAPAKADAHLLDALTGGAFSAATSGERAARVRDWLAGEPTPQQMQDVFKELSARDKGAARAIREKLDELRRAREQDQIAADWATKAQALLETARLNIADALAWQRDAAKAGAPLSREPLAGLKTRLAERVKSVEDLQNQVMVQREAAVLLAQRIEVLSTKSWRDAQTARAVLAADVPHWHDQASALAAHADWPSVEARYPAWLEAARTQLNGVWSAFGDALAQTEAAAADASLPLPPVPVWADELRAARGLPTAAQVQDSAHPEAAKPARVPRAESPERAAERAAQREKAVQAVTEALRKVEEEVAQGHAKASAGAAAQLRNALRDHGRHIPTDLDARVHTALTNAGELEGWQKWRADQLRDELIAKAEALVLRKVKKGTPPASEEKTGLRHGNTGDTATESVADDGASQAAATDAAAATATSSPAPAPSEASPAAQAASAATATATAATEPPGAQPAPEAAAAAESHAKAGIETEAELGAETRAQAASASASASAPTTAQAAASDSAATQQKTTLRHKNTGDEATETVANTATADAAAAAESSAAPVESTATPADSAPGEPTAANPLPAAPAAPASPAAQTPNPTPVVKRKKTIAVAPQPAAPQSTALQDEDGVQYLPAMGGRKLQEALRSLREQWKAIDQGGIPNHAQWKRFDAACTRAHTFVDAWLDKVRTESAEQKAQRQALIDEVTAWAAAHASAPDAAQPPRGADWKAQLRAIHQFSERWRNAGHLSDKAFAELQPQWKAAIHTAAAPLEAAQKASTERRHALIDEAKALGAAPVLRVDAVRALQQRWQAEAHTVPLERKHEQKLWDAFRKPIDEAFQRKDAEREKAAAATSAHDQAVLAAAKALEAANASGDASRIRSAMAALEAALRGQQTARDAAAPSTSAGQQKTALRHENTGSDAIHHVAPGAAHPADGASPPAHTQPGAASQADARRDPSTATQPGAANDAADGAALTAGSSADSAPAAAASADAAAANASSADAASATDSSADSASAAPASAEVASAETPSANTPSADPAAPTAAAASQASTQAASPSETSAAPAEASAAPSTDAPAKPAAKPIVVAVRRSDDRPGAKKTEPATGRDGRSPRPGDRRDGPRTDRRDAPRAPRGDDRSPRSSDRFPPRSDTGRPGGPSRFGDRSERGDRATPRFGSDRPERGPRLGDAAFRAQRDALDAAQQALKKLAAQAHGEALTQLLAAWQQRNAEQLPPAAELGKAVPPALRSQWQQAMTAAPQGSASDAAPSQALLRLEMAAEVPTPADHLAARRALQLQLLTRRSDPAPAQTWGQDAATVLSAAHDDASARRLQTALKALLRR